MLATIWTSYVNSEGMFPATEVAITNTITAIFTSLTV
jgi:hypothetical protein